MQSKDANAVTTQIESERLLWELAKICRDCASLRSKRVAPMSRTPHPGTTRFEDMNMITQKCRSKAITVGAAIAFTAAGLAFARAADLPQEYGPPPPVSQLPPPGYGAAPVYPPEVYPQPIYPPAAYADPVYVPAPV